MEDTLMQLIVISTIILGLILLIRLIWQRLFSNKSDTSSIEVDMLNTPISHAISGQAHNPSDKTVPIYGLSNLAEANALKSLLEDNGIDCMVHSFQDYAYDGMWQVQKGWGVLKVFEKDKAKAEDFINSFLQEKNQKSEQTLESPSQETSIPAGKTLLPKIIFALLLVILLGIAACIMILIYSGYRESGRKSAEEGYYYSLNNEHHKAIECYDKAIRRWYATAVVYYNRGFTKYNIGDLDGAIADWEHAIKLDSSLGDKLKTSINKAKQANNSYNHERRE